MLTVGADDLNFHGWMADCYGIDDIWRLHHACNTAANTKRLAGQLITEKASLRLVLTELNRRAVSTGGMCWSS